MPRYNTACIVLRSIQYKDADKIYTLYSKDRGKISAIAKGVRKISSKRSGSLDTLNHVVVGLCEGTSELKVITETQPVNCFGSIKASLEKAASGYYLSELMYRFIEEDIADPKLFALLLNTLTKLDNATEGFDKLINSFEVNFMQLLGYKLNFKECVFCGAAYSRDWSHPYFNFELGGLCCPHCKDKGIAMSSKNFNGLLKTFMGDKLDTDLGKFKSLALQG